MRGIKFVSVEFPNDPNVAGYTYWYLCEFDSAEVGSLVVAPLGSHNRMQQGVVRRVMFADEAYAPYPVMKIKRIESVVPIKQ